MSGPWDRPSSDDPDEWPSEDLGPSGPSNVEGGRKPSSQRDPGSEGAPGWDDWPPPPPPADDYVVEEPLRPSSDPWAESWTAEEADAMIGAASGEPTEPERDRWDTPPAPVAEPAVEPPAPVWQPEPSEPEPAQADAPAPSPIAEVGPASRIEPWSADADPWRFEPEEPAPPEAVQAAEPVREPDADVVPPAVPEPEPIEEPVEEPAPVVEPEPAAWQAPVARWPSRTDELPDWLAEPGPEPGGQDAPPPPEAFGEAEPVAAEPEPEPEPQPEPEGEPHPESTPAPVQAAQPEPPSVPFWKSILPWRSSESDAEAGGRSDAVAPRAEVEPEPQPAALAPEVEPRWPASVPEPVDADAGATEPEPAVADAWPEAEPKEVAEGRPTIVPLTGGLTYETLERSPGPDMAEAPATEPEPKAEPEPEPEPEPVPELVPTAADGWAEPGWADRGESTRVLPTDWTPPQRERADELPELSAAAARTTLADPDADLEDEASGTVAEQAVPWLIGVILLLAGMVIVLLALIFAGDGSLGGAGTGSPSPSPGPTLFAVGASPTPAPSPSATPAATGTPAATPTPEATPSQAPLPEFGPLEMVYQGRSAALAPIYLLRHDFTVDDEPDVLAQDAQFDVRRFAWAPDGGHGAGLLSDVLVSIEPGEEKRRLGDGLSTVTFGEDGSTVYAVRVTEDGEDDVATVLAIDFESGDTEDLASVTYERPEVDGEAALAEARVSDEGGPVRLFWTAEDRLHLWVLGAGAWTVDPADGTATELDGGALPIHWSPDGDHRIELGEDDGTTTLTLRNTNERALASTEVDGMVSHLRWSPGSDRVVFTLGRSAAGGGVLQNLFLWDLGDGDAPMQLTNTGAAFGAEWLGTRPLWREE